jgi:hypothetical protein
MQSTRADDKNGPTKAIRGTIGCVPPRGACFVRPDSKSGPDNSKEIQQNLRRNPVKKTGVVLALITLTLILTSIMTHAANPANPATNDDNPAGNSASVARFGVVSGAPIAVHPFVNVKTIQATGTKIFLANGDNVVNIYNTSGKQLGQLTGFNQPQGLATDGQGNLYVADTGNSRIQVYAPPYTKKPKTLSDPGQYPEGVSVLNDGEFVAVTNFSGSVTLYKKGKAGPTITVGRVYFCAFDAEGDLFVDGENSSGNFWVGEIANLTKGGKTLSMLGYNGTILFPGGVAVTTHGKIAILDQEAATIYTFNPPKNGSLGSPIASTPLTGASDPVTFVFTKQNKDFWDADAGLAQVDEFAYPAGGSAVKSLPVPGGGIAIVPAEIPGQ